MYYILAIECARQWSNVDYTIAVRIYLNNHVDNNFRISFTLNTLIIYKKLVVKEQLKWWICQNSFN